MAFDLMNLTSSFIQKQAVNEIIHCNVYSENFGLTLTEKQAAALVETRSFTLKANGRIEFGGGIIDKIIHEFCDSPYISQYNYEHTLHELIEMFYYYKNETLDLISDLDLIKFMKESYDGTCQGSLDLLSGRELDRLARNLRYGYDTDYNEDQTAETEVTEEDDYDVFQ